MTPARVLVPCALLALLLGGCSPPRGEFSVMTYNLFRYCHDDRDRDGQRNDPKPEAEVRAVLDTIAREKPDVLAVQEMGAPGLLADFAQRLAGRGLDYPHVECVPGSPTNLNIAVLSRFPFAARQSVTNETFSIGIMTYPVQRGFIDVDIAVNESYRFKLLVAHLKSKVYHPAGQTEMRRNEARLLGKHVRRALDAAPGLNLLVAGDLNDTPGSAPLEEIVGDKKGRILFDLRPADAFGDLWTHYWKQQDTYERLDYLLVSAGMQPEVVAARTRLVRAPPGIMGSDHRPVVGVFVARDMDSEPQVPNPGTH